MAPKDVDFVVDVVVVIVVVVNVDVVALLPLSFRGGWWGGWWCAQSFSCPTQLQCCLAVENATKSKSKLI